MTTTINASPTNGIVHTADGSGVMKLQSNGVTTNALAWVNFNGTTSPGTIRSQYNVSSVTKNATADYTVNFSTATTDANYAAVGITGSSSGGAAKMLVPGGIQTTTACRIAAYVWNASQTDSDYVSLVVFGN